MGYPNSVVGFSYLGMINVGADVSATDSSIYSPQLWIGPSNADASGRVGTTPLLGLNIKNITGWYAFYTNDTNGNGSNIVAKYPYVTDFGSEDTSTEMNTPSATTVVYRTINFSRSFGTSIPSGYMLYICPNTLTVADITSGLSTIVVNSDSPLFNYLSYNGGVGAYPKVGDSLVLKGMSTVATITSVDGESRGGGAWSATITTDTVLPSVNVGDVVYTWTPNGSPDLTTIPTKQHYTPVQQVTPVQPPGVNTTPITTPVGEQNTLAPTTISDPPLLDGTVVANQLYNVAAWYNQNYPGFDFNYDPKIYVGSTVTAESIDNFLSALGNCNNAWSGKSALPSKYNFDGGDTIIDLQFKTPSRIVQDIIFKEFFVWGNNTAANAIVVPPGLRYLNVEWCMAAGGAGGFGSGFFWNAADWPARAGGAGAFAHNIWVNVQEGDIITATVGQQGYTSGGDGGSGGDTTLVLSRPSENYRTYVLCHVTGGNGGVSNSTRWGNTWTPGGVVVSTIGATGYSGANSIAGPMYTNPMPGTTGGSSPLGNPGNGSGSASGYGAGGGGGYFYDAKHHSTANGGGNGAPGYVRVNLYMYTPKTVYVYKPDEGINNTSQAWNSSDL